jgi:16S rRNA (guanine527-N7)-methyltransferase
MLQGPEEAVNWEQRLARGCRLLNISLDEKQIRFFRIYRDLLLEWNPRASLISSADEGRILTRHFLDSLSLLKVLDILPGTQVLDVGSGGGFPGLPVKICRPRIRITLLEPKEKRYYFLRSLVQALELEDVILLRERAKEACSDPGLAGSFDLVLARAVAAPNRSTELCFPLVRPGGLFVYYRGRWLEGEEDRTCQGVSGSNGEVLGMVRVDIQRPGPDRYLLVAQKNRENLT